MTPQELQNKRKEIMNSSKKSFDIMSELRLGDLDYDLANKTIIKEGGQAEVYQVKSKIDKKIYAAKKFNFPIESKEKMWTDLRM